MRKNSFCSMKGAWRVYREARLAPCPLPLATPPPPLTSHPSSLTSHPSLLTPGFTIIELLVASMLLGLLVTILTMVFNQSSIAWRIGVAGVSDMDDVRDNMAEIREEADNAFAYGGQIYRTVGLWDENGDLRDRACDAPGSLVEKEDGGKYCAKLLRKNLNASNLTPSDLKLINVGNAKAAASVRNYTVNVMSGGPKNDVTDWQAIWSFPDDPSEW